MTLVEDIVVCWLETNYGIWIVQGILYIWMQALCVQKSCVLAHFRILMWVWTEDQILELARVASHLSSSSSLIHNSKSLSTFRSVSSTRNCSRIKRTSKVNIKSLHTKAREVCRQRGSDTCSKLQSHPSPPSPLISSSFFNAFSASKLLLHLRDDFRDAL